MNPGEEAGISEPMDHDKQFKEKEVERLVVESTSDSSDTEHATALSVADDVDSDGSLLSAGTLIAGHYEVLSIIGQGAMGTVYKVRHLLVDQIRAVKLLRVSKETQILRRFQQEAKASLALEHPNIVRVFEFGIEPQMQQPYLVMEYVEGDALSAVLEKKQKLTCEDAYAIIAQVCEALAHAHAKGIIHRDIKPANIVLTRDSNGAELAKLVDFGIAKLTTPEDRQNLTQTGEIFGTPLYMSPEQCLGQKVDARSDIYSLGCVIYECLAGKPPFEGGSSLETITMHVNADSVPNFSGTKISASFESVICKTLETKMVNRFQTVSDLHSALQDAVRNQSFVERSLADIARPSRLALAKRRLRIAGMWFILLSYFVMLFILLWLAELIKSQ